MGQLIGQSNNSFTELNSDGSFNIFPENIGNNANVATFMYTYVRMYFKKYDILRSKVVHIYILAAVISGRHLSTFCC